MSLSLGQILHVLKTATMIMIALIRRYVSIVNARGVVEMITIVKLEQPVTKMYVLLPAKGKNPAHQHITATLTIRLVFQNVPHIKIVKLITSVMEVNAFNLVLDQINVLQLISTVTSKLCLC